MKRILILLSGFVLSVNVYSQSLERPKLVVGIVVDQMRWDFLYRYYDRYANDGGFKRMLNQGFSCENTWIPYTPTVTAPGHSSIYTGTVPAIHGITGNIWWDNQLNRSVYCTEDNTVNTVGSKTKAGQMSPRNMLVTTICDEMRLATNFRSKTIGIAQKDRGGILCAGHNANASYWYDNATGDWITSTYYMNELPKWVKDLNAKKLVDKYYQSGWNTLYPINTYLQSTADEKTYEGKTLGKSFPYDLKKFAGKNYYPINVTPYGNTLTIEMVKAAISNEQLGADEFTDFLTISFSSPDYIGHTFGPNSIETEDCFLRLDKELGAFMDFLDANIGKGNFTVFLSADHGVANVPGFLKEHNVPAGSVDMGGMIKAMNEKLKEKYGTDKLVTGSYNHQLVLNHALIDSLKLNKDEIKRWSVDYLSAQPVVARAFPIDELSETILNEKIKKMVANGYYPQRCGDIQIILHSQWMESFGTTGTTHGSWNPYDSHIPLLWYGWGIKQGKLNREVYMTDIAPTLAALLHIQMPSGSVGHPIEEAFK